MITATDPRGPWSDPKIQCQASHYLEPGNRPKYTEVTRRAGGIGSPTLLSIGGAWPHAASIFRSQSVNGPWENNPGNPIVTNRDVIKAPICCTGHADLVEDKDGNWWTVMLAVRSPSRNSPMGRETFLAPVVWRDGWPIVNEGKELTRILPRMALPKGVAKQQNKNLDFFSDFDELKLDLAWNTIRTPPTKLWWQLEPKNEALRLNLRLEEIDNFVHPSFLGVRVLSASVDVSALVDFHPVSENEVAGIALERGHVAEWTVVKKRVGNDLVASAYWDSMLLGRRTLASDTPVEMKISLRHPVITLLFKEFGGDWQEIIQTRTSLLGSPPTGTGGRFTGAYGGVYASS